MLTVIYCTKETNSKHREHLIKTSGLHKHLEVIEIINNGESLTKSYNRGLKQAKNQYVVFCHDDISIETKQWAKKLIKQFESNPSFGIIGVAGSKYLNETGKWWSNKDTMYGRVKHTQNGKTWLSAYSSEQGLELEPVLNIDGVWFAINKNVIKEDFDESVEGFHFYDVDFSFRNHLAGCCVGVTTKIRINHHSVGETNGEWERNRDIFANKFKDILPIKLNENFKIRRLKVMIPHSGDINSLKSVIKLGGELVKLGVSVGVVGNFEHKTHLIAKTAKVKQFLLQEPPSFIKGNGIFQLQTQNGPITAEKDKLYKVGECEYDIIYTDDINLLESYRKMYPECKVIDINDSEYINIEKTAENYKEFFIKTYNG